MTNWQQRTIKVAQQYGIDSSIAVKQMLAESGGNERAKSYAGAMGLMQFMPGTWATYGRGDPYSGEDSLQAWGRYMTKLLHQFGGRYDLALAGYNSGENRAEYRNAANEGRAINWGVLPAGVQSQTQNYVNKILAGSVGDINLSAAITDSSALPLIAVAAIVLYLIT